MTIDKRDAIFTEETVVSAVIDIGGNEKIGLWLHGEIPIDVGRMIQFGESAAGMAIDGPHDQRESAVLNAVAQQPVVAGDIQESFARKAGRRWNVDARNGLQENVQAIAVKRENLLRQIDNRPRPVSDKLLDLAKRSACRLRIRRHNDSDIVRRQRIGQWQPRNNVKRVELDVGILEQELEGGIAANVRGGGQRQYPQTR